MHKLEGNVEGLNRTKQKKFAFFMEVRKHYLSILSEIFRHLIFQSSTIEYMVQRQCKVQQVGNLLDEKGYGIGMKKGKNITNFVSIKLKVDQFQIHLFVVLSVKPFCSCKNLEKSQE